MTKVNILGTEYDFSTDDLNNPELAEADGKCDLFDKKILLRKKEYMPGYSNEAKDYRYSHVLRHELIHAIAQECGVPYGDDEALVDWIAHIIPLVNGAIVRINMSESGTELKSGE